MATIPEAPQNWYYIGRSSHFGAGARKVTVAGRDYVLFRGENRRLVALHAYCSHMGADLSKGKVKNHCIVCPFHAWHYDETGRCVKIPSSQNIPEFARQQVFPVQERHGLVFLFNAKTALFDLPFFQGCDPDDFFCDNVVRITQNAPWYIGPANAFDVPHFEFVHKRPLTAAPDFKFISPYGAQIVNRYKIADSSLSDRLIRAVSGDAATMRFTSWGGSFNLAEIMFEKFTNYMMIQVEPVKKNTAVSNIFVFSPGAKRGPAYRAMQMAPMKLRSYFSKKFFQAEADEFENIHLNQNSLIDSDKILKTYVKWLTLLEAGGAELSRFTNHEAKF